MIGRTISHYEIVEKLGEGGMGVVYKARDLRLNRIVAVKFLPENLLQFTDTLERFQQEAEAISALNHPNIATIYELEETEGRKFLVLEYLGGGTLKSAIKTLHLSGRELPVKDVLEYGIQAAEGLGHAHQHGIVHRDVKTDNMMLTEDRKVKITDFGLARLRGAVHLTKTGSTVGTAAYMSPEQIRGEEVDQRSDLFSFGVVLYELTTGRLPFRGDHEAALSYAIVNEAPVPAGSLRQGLSGPLERVIERCLEKDKGSRYQSADEIAGDLRGILTGSRETGRVSSGFSKRARVAAVLGALFLAGAMIAILLLLRSRPAAAEGNSVAVLPFRNLNQDIDLEYFSDGMTEDIITHLSKIANLRVISRTSAMRFKNTEKSTTEIGNDLNVTTLLQGSVRRSGNRVRIGAQLIRAGDDENIWAETYDRELTDVFGIQSQIAQEIAAALKVKLDPGPSRGIAQRPTENPEAYDLYLRGRFQWNKRVPVSLLKSVELFHQATEKDPGYAAASAGLADAYTLIGTFGLLPPGVAFPQARSAAMRALQIDSTLGDAHASLAFVLMYYDWKWSDAEKEFAKAIHLNPGNAVPHSWYSMLLTLQGRTREVQIERKRAGDLDPQSPVIRSDLGLESYFQRDYDRAIDDFQGSLKLDPLFVAAYVPMGGAYLQKKMYAEAIDAFQHASMFSQGHPITVAALGYAYALTGRTEDAVSMLDLLVERRAGEYVPPYWIAVLEAGLGKRDAAFDWLQKAFDEKDPSLVYLRFDPSLDGLRSDPRFSLLVQKVGLGS
jgi:serine/threonine-protein kinase